MTQSDWEDLYEEHFEDELEADMKKDPGVAKELLKGQGRDKVHNAVFNKLQRDLRKQNLKRAAMAKPQVRHGNLRKYGAVKHSGRMTPAARKTAERFIQQSQFKWTDKNTVAQFIPGTQVKVNRADRYYNVKTGRFVRHAGHG